MTTNAQTAMHKHADRGARCVPTVSRRLFSQPARCERPPERLRRGVQVPPGRPGCLVVCIAPLGVASPVCAAKQRFVATVAQCGLCSAPRRPLEGASSPLLVCVSAISKCHLTKLLFPPLMGTLIENLKTHLEEQIWGNEK